MSVCFSAGRKTTVLSLDGRIPDRVSASRMRTLFADTIRSAPPKDQPQVDPNTLTFVSSIQSSKATSPFSSNDSSYKTDGWLTNYIQNQSGSDGPTSYTHGEPTTPTPRRRGNPKVLFMGMRRCVAAHAVQNLLHLLTNDCKVWQIVNTEGGVSKVLTSRYFILGANDTNRIGVDAVSASTSLSKIWLMVC